MGERIDPTQDPAEREEELEETSEDVEGHRRRHVHLDEADDIRVLFLHETGDAVQDFLAGAQIARARERQVEGWPDARGISNVVDEESQGRRC